MESKGDGVGLGVNSRQRRSAEGQHVLVADHTDRHPGGTGLADPVQLEERGPPDQPLPVEPAWGARSRSWPSERTEATSAPDVGRLRRRDVLVGLVHEYEYAA
jgi:hypothetical protein